MFNVLNVFNVYFHLVYPQVLHRTSHCVDSEVLTTIDHRFLILTLCSPILALIIQYYSSINRTIESIQYTSCICTFMHCIHVCSSILILMYVCTYIALACVCTYN